MELCLSEVINAWVKSPLEEHIQKDHLRIDEKSFKTDVNNAKNVQNNNSNNGSNNSSKDSVTTRHDLKYTVKVFPSATASQDEVFQLIEQLMRELGVEFIDALIVALPGFGGGEDGNGAASGNADASGSGGGGSGGVSSGREGMRGGRRGSEDVVPVVARPRGRVESDGGGGVGCIEEAMKIWKVLERLYDSGKK